MTPAQLDQAVLMLSNSLVTDIEKLVKKAHEKLAAVIEVSTKDANNVPRKTAEYSLAAGKLENIIVAELGYQFAFVWVPGLSSLRSPKPKKKKK